MKTKLELAHEYAMQHMDERYVELTVERAWQYADAMYAELEKRKDTSRPDVLFEPMTEWQPDWSQAPKGTDAWRMYGDGNCAWLVEIDGVYRWWSNAPSFNYKGNWRDSLRKRP